MLERTAQDEVADVRMRRPHVVILGAGASRAAFPNGDRHGKVLPLMADFATCLGLESMLRGWGFDPSTNFEDTYSTLHDRGESDKLSHLNRVIRDYFSGLEIPDEPTLYDHLILSLRSTDFLATFNWDPLLLQAYVRCLPKGLRGPKLAFLHGNVASGYCEKDATLGLVIRSCSQCGELFKPSPLLFPIRHKNYADDPGIAEQWRRLHLSLEAAFMITVFGYSGPKTDQEAIGAMQKAWGNVAERAMEQTAFITLQTDAEVSDAWANFIHTHHYERQNNFYESWIAKHPRRTGEAYLSQYLDAQFIDDNPIPRDLGWEELWKWFGQFVEPEMKAKLPD